MFTTLALLAFTAGAQALTVASPPSLVQCQPIKLTWSEGTAPFYLSVIPAGQASAAPLVSFPTMSETSYTWIVNLPAGTGITVQIKDSTGTTAFSSPVTVMAGTDDSCMNPSASDSAAPSSETGAEASPSPSPSPSSSSSAAAASSSAPAPVSSSSAAAPASSAPVSSAASSKSSSVAASSAKPSSSAAAASAPAQSAGSSAGRVAVGGAVGGAVAAVAGLIALAAF